MATDGSPAFHHGLYFLELVCTKCHFTKILEAALLAIEVVQSFGNHILYSYSRDTETKKSTVELPECLEMWSLK